MNWVVPFEEWTARGRWWPTTKRRGTASALVLHHTVTQPTIDPYFDARVVESVIWGRRFQAGFSSVPYSYLIHPDGTTFEARGVAWRNAANRKGKPSSALNNHNTLSVALIGRYDRDGKVTTAQRRAFNTLSLDLAAAGHLGSPKSVVGHSALAYTACPGNALTQIIHAPNEELQGMETLVSNTNGEAWAVAGQRARKITNVSAWLASWDGPVLRANNMEHVVDDLYDVVN